MIGCPPPTNQSSLISQMTLIILVLVQNVNDNAPIFPKDTYQIQVKEVSALRKSVYVCKPTLTGSRLAC